MEIIGILAYPGVLFLLGLIGIAVFRKPVAKKIEAGGFRYKDLQIGTQQQEEAADADPGVVDRVRSVHDLAALGDNPAIIEGQKIIEEELQRRNINDPSDAAHILTRYLSAAALAIRAERLYGSIFGGQISVLQHLNSARRIGEDVAVIRDQFYEPLGDMLKTVSPFDRFIGWMEAAGLVSRNDDQILITDFGVYFLTYIASQGLNINKKP